MMKKYLSLFVIMSLLLMGVIAVNAQVVDLVGGDNIITQDDILEFFKAWHSNPESPNYNPDADVNNDNIVDIDDLNEIIIFYQLPIPAVTSTPTQIVPTPTEGIPTITPTQGVPTPTPTTGAGTFDIKDYFILIPGSTWHYTGIGFEGGSGTTEDDFRWTVLDGMKDVGGGKSAFQIQTLTDEPDDDRNQDTDFWYVDAEGSIFFVGFQKIQDSSALPPQTVILSNPLLLGKENTKIGDQFSTTSPATVTVKTPFGNQTISGNLTAEVNYTSFIPSIPTPLGNFTNALRMVINFKIAVPLIGDIPYKDNTFIFKKNVGMVIQDQQPDVNDAQVQGIDGGTVNGQPVVAN